MLKKVKYMAWLALFLTALSCRRFYSPELKPADTSILVVEGLIDPGTDSTTVNLSHTVEFSQKTSISAETGATVTIEGNGAVYRLSEIRRGTYAAAGLSLNSTKKYRLKIHTASNRDYLSDEMEVKITPPIDTFAYKMQGTSLHFNASTHDAANNTRYYRWDFVETYRFNALYLSNYKIITGDNIVPRIFPQDDIYHCYASNPANAILLATSEKIGEDIITNMPIQQIKAGDERLGIRYSILLREYALTKEAYAFWENLKKNTEKLGSIFDALPTELVGNIHNVATPTAPVIGYMSISTVTTKRIWVDRTELPSTYEWRVDYPIRDCGLPIGWKFEDYKGSNVIPGNELEYIYYPLDALTGRDPATGKEIITGYSYIARACADCTLRGFTNKPGFWTERI